MAVFAPGAQASPYAKAAVMSCDREEREAVFEGRVTSYRGSAKMQLRFTLQALTPDRRAWRTIGAEGFGTWITAPAGLRKYTYDKTVQNLLAPASYRSIVHFRWRDGRGRLVRSERVVSAACKQTDSRADLVVRSVRLDAEGRYVAVVVNRGREATGIFEVELVSGGVSLGNASVPGLQPKATDTVRIPSSATAPCVAGEQVEAVADAGSEVDEADEENNSLAMTC
jgi:hypothetical protein